MHMMGYILVLMVLILIRVQGAFGQAAISTGDLARAAGGGSPGDASSAAAASVQDSSAAVDLNADSSMATSTLAPAPAPVLPAAPVPAPARAPSAPRAKAPVAAPARAPIAAPIKAPFAAPARAPSKAPSRAKAPAPSKAVSRTSSFQSGAPTQAPAQAPAPSAAAGANTTADITNIIQARAGVFTRAGTLVLAGLTPRVDWVSDLGPNGKRTGRFAIDYFVSAAFNESSPTGSAWLGDPQAVIQGTINGSTNETTMVAILSKPRYNASGDTLSFVVRPVTDASALNLIAGAANAALSGDPAMRLNSTTAGLIIRDIIIYIDDATRTESWEPSPQPGQKGTLVSIGPWGSPFGGGWNPCVGAARQVWRDGRVRRNYFGCGPGAGIWG
ncbi:g10992 [Coccomyxa elongata]